MIRTRYYTPKQKRSSCVEVKIEGVPVTGLIDTGSDITIIRGDLFYHILETARLEESSLKPADLNACTYDQKPITLDGQIDLHISFGERVICTTVYVKLVAPDQLLLSETVFCQLGIVSYHPSVQSVQGCHTTGPSTSTIDCESDTLRVSDQEVPTPTLTLQSESVELGKQVSSEGNLTLQSRITVGSEQPAAIAENNKRNLTESHPPSQVTKGKIDVQGTAPQNNGDVMSQVRIIKAVRLPANYSAAVPVQVTQIKGTILLEPSKLLNQSLQVEESLLEVKEDGSTATAIQVSSLRKAWNWAKLLGQQ